MNLILTPGNSDEPVIIGEILKIQVYVDSDEPEEIIHEALKQMFGHSVTSEIIYVMEISG